MIDLSSLTTINFKVKLTEYGY